jgi:Fe-S-cluster containining protein
MTGIRSVRIATDCASCSNKCCNQTYDWVYLTPREVERLEAASAVPAREFMTYDYNSRIGNTVALLRLPCRFLDQKTGTCSVYENRPLICRLYPFYPEPLAGRVALLPGQCGTHLSVLPMDAHVGWCLDDIAAELEEWLDELWRSARSPVAPTSDQ